MGRARADGIKIKVSICYQRYGVEFIPVENSGYPTELTLELSEKSRNWRDLNLWVIKQILLELHSNKVETDGLAITSTSVY